MTVGTLWWLAALLLFVAALVQASVAPFIAAGRIRPDLVLVLVVCWALLQGPKPALVWSFLGGLWLDLLSGAMLGTAILALSFVAYVCTVGLTPWFKPTALLAAVVTFGATFLYAALYLFLLRTQQLPGEAVWLAAWRAVTLPAAITNAALAVPAFWLLAALARWTPRARGR